MIIKIKQTASNIKQMYLISGDYSCQGKIGNESKYQRIELYNKNGELLFCKYHLSHWTNYIPIRYLFVFLNLTREFQIFKNGSYFGNFVFSRHGYYKSCYIITLTDGSVLYCYTRLKGSFNYISIYKDDIQIALVETYLTVTDFNYTHKLYLPDDYSEYKEVLSLFVLYFANYNFTKRFHMTAGTSFTKGWSYSQYNDKYDPSWREKYFPKENFFGKLNLFDEK